MKFWLQGLEIIETMLYLIITEIKKTEMKNVWRSLHLGGFLFMLQNRKSPRITVKVKNSLSGSAVQTFTRDTGSPPALFCSITIQTLLSLKQTHTEHRLTVRLVQPDTRGSQRKSAHRHLGDSPDATGTEIAYQSQIVFPFHLLDPPILRSAVYGWGGGDS